MGKKKVLVPSWLFAIVPVYLATGHAAVPQWRGPRRQFLLVNYSIPGTY